MTIFNIINYNKIVMFRKRSITPERIRRRRRRKNKKESIDYKGYIVIVLWFIGLIIIGNNDTNFGKNPDADLINTSIYIFMTFILLFTS